MLLDSVRRFSASSRSASPGSPQSWQRVTRRQARVIGFVAALVSVVASALLLHAAPRRAESLDEALMLLFSCLTVGAMLVLPRRDCNPGTIGGNALPPRVHAAGLLDREPAGSARRLDSDHDPLLPGAAGSAPRTWRPRAGLLLSSVALALAIALIAADGHAHVDRSA